MQDITFESTVPDKNWIEKTLKRFKETTKNKKVYADVDVIEKRLRLLADEPVTADVKTDYLIIVERYLQAVNIRINEKVDRFTYLPKDGMFNLVFRFVYDVELNTGYMAPAIEPLRDFLAICSCVKLPHEVQIGICHVLVLGCGLNKNYLSGKTKECAKTERTMARYCDDIDRMVASAKELALNGFFD